MDSAKERPILFSGPMVRAILDGRKTQTRRIQKVRVDADGVHARCPYGVPGDRLWVRETAYIAWPDFSDPSDGNVTDADGKRRIVGYVASMDAEACEAAEQYGVKRTPSIYMPRWASRITLDVTAVRVERLHDITEEDARAEGVPVGEPIPARLVRDGKTEPATVHFFNARDSFSHGWDAINGKRAAWASNPWVWVVAFKRVEPDRE